MQKVNASVKTLRSLSDDERRDVDECLARLDERARLYDMARGAVGRSVAQDGRMYGADARRLQGYVRAAREHGIDVLPYIRERLSGRSPRIAGRRGYVTPPEVRRAARTIAAIRAARAAQAPAAPKGNPWKDRKTTRTVNNRMGVKFIIRTFTGTTGAEYDAFLHSRSGLEGVEMRAGGNYPYFRDEETGSSGHASFAFRAPEPPPRWVGWVQSFDGAESKGSTSITGETEEELRADAAAVAAHLTHRERNVARGLERVCCRCVGFKQVSKGGRKRYETKPCPDCEGVGTFETLPDFEITRPEPVEAEAPAAPTRAQAYLLPAYAAEMSDPRSPRNRAARAFRTAVRLAKWLKDRETCRIADELEDWEIEDRIRKVLRIRDAFLALHGERIAGASAEAPTIAAEAPDAGAALTYAPIDCNAPAALSVAVALPPAAIEPEPIDWPSYQVTIHGMPNCSQIDTTALPEPEPAPDAGARWHLASALRVVRWEREHRAARAAAAGASPEPTRRRWNMLPAPRALLALPAPTRAHDPDAGACCDPAEAEPCKACRTPTRARAPIAATLEVEINGKRYGLAVVTLGSAYLLESAGGAAYEVTQGDAGAACTCKDFDVRHRGLPTEGCKHVVACRSLGLLTPTRAHDDEPADPAREILTESDPDWHAPDGVSCWGCGSVFPEPCKPTCLYLADRPTPPDAGASAEPEPAVAPELAAALAGWTPDAGASLAPICGGSDEATTIKRRRTVKDDASKARDRLRKLQDRIVAIADRREYPEHISVSADLPTRITVESLRHFIEPDYEAELRRLLAEWESQD